MRSSLISLLWIILGVASLLVATAAVSVSVSSVSGTDISSCGSAVSPCRTLAYGICGVLAPLMSCNASCAAAGTRTVGVVYLLAGDHKIGVFSAGSGVGGTCNLGSSPLASPVDVDRTTMFYLNQANLTIVGVAGQTTLRRDLVSPTAGQVGTDRTGLFALDNSFLHLEGLQILNFGNGTQSGPVVKAKASAVEIFSSNFQNNYGTNGGVGWFSQSQVSISATRFDSLNKALDSGSALFLQGSSVLVCSNCSFVGMTLSGDNNINGGMICASKSALSIADSTFSDLHLTDSSQPHAGYIYLDQCDSRIIRTVFRNSQITAIYAISRDATGISRLVINNSLFYGFVAENWDHGGNFYTIFAGSTEATITGTTFEHFTMNALRGQMANKNTVGYQMYSNITLNNCTIIDHVLNNQWTDQSYLSCDCCYFVIANCIMKGGLTTGMYLSSNEQLDRNMHSTLDISDSIFDTVVTPWDGGVFNLGNSRVTIIRSQFLNSKAGQIGGVIKAEKCSLWISNSTFVNSQAKNGAHLFLEMTQALIENCTFIGGSTPDSGGAIYYSLAGNLPLEFPLSLTIRDSHFQANIAARGACIFLTNPSGFLDVVAVIENCFMENNVALTTGAVISASKLPARMSRSLVVGNSAILDTLIYTDALLQLQAVEFISNKVITVVNVVEPSSMNGASMLCLSSASCLVVSGCRFADNSGSAITIQKNNDASVIRSANVSLATSHFWTESSAQWPELLIQTSTIERNGGGVVVNAAFWSVHVDQVILKDAKAVDGAALTVSGVAHVLLSNSTIGDNENTNHGAVYGADTAQLYIHTSRFLRNRAKFPFGHGAAISIQDHVLLSVVDSVFLNNNATDNGGAVSLDSASAQAFFKGCRFEMNAALNGGMVPYVTVWYGPVCHGAITSFSTAMSIYQTLFRSNDAYGFNCTANLVGYGGAIYFAQDNIPINCDQLFLGDASVVFDSNTALISGAAVFSEKSPVLCAVDLSTRASDYFLATNTVALTTTLAKSLRSTLTQTSPSTCAKSGGRGPCGGVASETTDTVSSGNQRVSPNSLSQHLMSSVSLQLVPSLSYLNATFSVNASVQIPSLSASKFDAIQFKASSARSTVVITTALDSANKISQGSAVLNTAQYVTVAQQLTALRQTQQSFVTLNLQPGKPFDLTLQTYDAVGFPLTSHISIMTQLVTMNAGRLLAIGQNLGDSFCQLGSVTFRGMSLAIHKSLVSPSGGTALPLPVASMPPSFTNQTKNSLPAFWLNMTTVPPFALQVTTTPTPSNPLLQSLVLAIRFDACDEGYVLVPLANNPDYFVCGITDALGSGSMNAISALSAFNLALLLFAGVVMMYYSQIREVAFNRVGGSLLLFKVVAGVIVCIAALMFSVSPSDSICSAKYPLMSTAVYFMLAFSLATVYRLNRIFINEKLDTVVITNGDLVKYTITGMFLIELVPILLWLSMSPSKLMFFQQSCLSSMDGLFIGWLSIIKLILVFVGLALCFRLPKSNLLHAADSVRRSSLMSALFLLVAIGIFIGSSSAALFPIMALLLVLADLAFILMPATLQIATSSEDSMRAAQSMTQASRGGSHVQMRAGSQIQQRGSTLGATVTPAPADKTPNTDGVVAKVLSDEELVTECASKIARLRVTMQVTRATQESQQAELDALLDSFAAHQLKKLHA